MDKELLKTLDTAIADLTALIRRSRHLLNGLASDVKAGSSSLAQTAPPRLQELQAAEEETRRLLAQYRESLKKLATSIADHSTFTSEEE